MMAHGFIVVVISAPARIGLQWRKTNYVDREYYASLLQLLRHCLPLEWECAVGK